MWTFLSIICLCLVHPVLHAQTCPPNIDFENGTFDGWTCYIGSTASVNGKNEITLAPSAGPVIGRHTMYSSNSNAGLDPYGGFPINCPNGSGYSVRLGNDLAGTQAEGISYEFTIPASQNTYSLIYHYAVVFQDPNHLQTEQPRMEIEITNVTDDQVITCASFTFYPFGSLLPGFYESPNPGSDTPVWCKDWSAVSINLNGNAGKTIRLFFKTADCTFRRHFGYAYIDVNSECSGEFVGAAYCPDDTAVNIVAPYGYQNYTWFNNTFTQTLGTQQTLRLAPPPPPGTNVAVEVIPYHGYGCPDTLFALLIDTLKVVANAGRDTISCNRNPVRIGGPPRAGLVYSWSPATGLSNAQISNPIASPDFTTEYIVSVNSSGGGCLDTDTVIVEAFTTDSSLQLIGKASFCIDSEDSAVLRVPPGGHIQWYKDNSMINGANQNQYNVMQSGTYYAVITSTAGCMVSTRKQNVFIDSPRPGIRYPVEYALINAPLTLEARPFGETALWTPATYLDNSSSFTPVFKGSTEQSYTISIMTSSGCVTVDTQQVIPVKSVELYVPTAFTPNNDGLNDILRPILMGVKELRYFRVFNRWGQLLFETKTERSGWDGRFNGIPQSSQVFVWLVQGMGVDGKIYTRKGTSTLIR